MAISFALAQAALAQATVERIDTPLRFELRSRVADLLKKVRPKDFNEALANTKMLWKPSSSNQIILRIEAACIAERCMTLVARVTEQEIVPELTLDAGQSVLVNDVLWPVWGSEPAPSLMFEGHDGAGLLAVARKQGWVLSACGGCTNWFPYTRTERPRAPAEPPQPVIDSFEAIRRTLESFGKSRN